MLADFSAQIAKGHVYLAECKVVDQWLPVGYVVHYSVGDLLHLENVAVMPQWRGRGIGGQLIAHAEDTARRLGLAGVHLYTNEVMTENLQLYPALGYVEIERKRVEGFNRVYFQKSF